MGPVLMSFNAVGSPGWANATYTSDNATFDIYPYNPETWRDAWLNTPKKADQDIPSLAPVLPDDTTYIGQGTFFVKPKGVAVVEGQAGSKEFPPVKVWVKFAIHGTTVDMWVEFPATELKFQGYIRGEGKSQ